MGTIRIEGSHCIVGGRAEFEAPEGNAVGEEIEEKKLKETEQFEVDEDGVRSIGMRMPAIQPEVVVIDD